MKPEETNKKSAQNSSGKCNQWLQNAGNQCTPIGFGLSPRRRPPPPDGGGTRVAGEGENELGTAY